MGNLLRGSKIMDDVLILFIEKIMGKNEKRISFTFKDFKPTIIFTFIPLIFEIVSVILIKKKLFETISMLVFIVSCFLCHSANLCNYSFYLYFKAFI